MYQLILGQTVRGSDLVLTGMETVNEETKLSLFLDKSFKLHRENMNTNCYTTEELKGLEYPAHFKTALIVDC